MSAPLTAGPIVPSPRTAYDDPYSPADLHADCAAAGAALDLPGGARGAARSAGIHFEDVPRGLPASEAELLANAHKLAAVLSLEED